MLSCHMTEDEMNELTTEELQMLLPGLLMKTEQESACAMRWHGIGAVALKARTDLKRRRELSGSVKHLSENMYL